MSAVAVICGTPSLLAGPESFQLSATRLGYAHKLHNAAIAAHAWLHPCRCRPAACAAAALALGVPSSTHGSRASHFSDKQAWMLDIWLTAMVTRRGKGAGVASHVGQTSLVVQGTSSWAVVQFIGSVRQTGFAEIPECSGCWHITQECTSCPRPCRTPAAQCSLPPGWAAEARQLPWAAAGAGCANGSKKGQPCGCKLSCV